MKTSAILLAGLLAFVILLVALVLVAFLVVLYQRHSGTIAQMPGVTAAFEEPAAPDPVQTSSIRPPRAN